MRSDANTEATRAGLEAREEAAVMLAELFPEGSKRSDSPLVELAFWNLLGSIAERRADDLVDSMVDDVPWTSIGPATDVTPAAAATRHRRRQQREGS